MFNIVIEFFLQKRLKPKFSQKKKEKKKKEKLAVTWMFDSFKFHFS